MKYLAAVTGATIPLLLASGLIAFGDINGNGAASVQTVAHKHHLKRGPRGPRGHRGRRGHEGIPGLPGVPGPPGPINTGRLSVHPSAPLTLTAGQTGSITAFCTDGSPVSGGYSSSTDDVNTWQSGRVTEGWQIKATNKGTVTAEVVSLVYCLPGGKAVVG